MTSIARTGFLVSVASYFVFLLADYIRPGFVSTVFSVHLFLIQVVGFGIWYGLDRAEGASGSKIADIVLRFLLGITLAILFWIEGEAFGDFRLVLALVALLLPFVVARRPN